jgi:hypothetical protein
MMAAIYNRFGLYINWHHYYINCDQTRSRINGCTSLSSSSSAAASSSLSSSPLLSPLLSLQLPLLPLLPLLLLLPSPPLPPPAFAAPVVGWLLRCCQLSAIIIPRRHATVNAYHPSPPLLPLPLPLGCHCLHRHHHGQTCRHPLPKKIATAAAPPAY